MNANDHISADDVINAARSIGLELDRAEADLMLDGLREQLSGFEVLLEIDTDGVSADDRALKRKEAKA